MGSTDNISWTMGYSNSQQGRSKSNSMDAVYNTGAVWGVNMEKLRQDHYTRVQDRCKKRTRYFIDEDRAYSYKSCVYLEMANAH